MNRVVALSAVPAAAESSLVSVVVPVGERPQPLVELYAEFSASLRARGIPFEFLFAAEPWARELVAPLIALSESGEPVRVLEAAQSVGETALLMLGATHARGNVLVTLPAYRRVQADALPALIDRVRQGADLAAARRWPRRDSWVNRAQSRAFNALVARLSGGRVHDVASGVRAIRRDVLLEMQLYGDSARFLPLLAIREGYRVEEVPAEQHPSDETTRVYSPGIYVRRLIDVLGLFFMLQFTEKPLRFFGLIGAALGGVGALALITLLAERLGGRAIADRPLLLLGVLLVVLGAQAIALGLIGEIIVHVQAPRRKTYRVAREKAE